jgi:hypothetical protein
MASHGKLGNYDLCAEKLKSIEPEKLRPEPLITGDDLKALGLKPGPEFKRILTEVEDRQLEGALNDKESALKFVREKFK